MTKNAQDEARIAARLAETIKSIEDMKLGHESLVRMAATYAIGYFDLQKLVEKQEKTIEAHDDLHKLLPVIFEKFREQAEAIDAFTPLPGVDDEHRADLVRRNTTARRIDAGIKLQKSKIARAAVSSRPDIKLKAKQKRDFWDKHIGSVRDSGEPVNNALDIIDALSKRDPRCASISTTFIKEWAKSDGMVLKGGRRKTKK